MKKITLIPGDGIGYEISESLVKIFDAAKVPVEFETENAGSDVYEKTGELIPESLYESVERNKIAIKGPITTPIGKGFRSINVYLRKKYDLYTNFRPSRNLPGIETRYDNIDLAIFRENTEGIYIGEEKYENEEKTSAIAVKRITRKGSERIIRSAFEYAKNNGISKVTVVHKANILKFTDGMFLDIAREISKEYENIQLEELIIDNMCMQLVTNPERFKVIVTMNLYGDILSDLVAGLVGGLGVAPGANIGDDIAIFEAVHGSAPDIAGQNKANPLALLLSSIEMLKYLKLDDFAKNIEKAILKKMVTDDNGNFNNVKMIPNTVTDVVTALRTNIDAVWVYYAWDGVATKLAGLKTNFLKFVDYGPELDFYSPVIIANNDYLKKNPNEAKKVLKAIEQVGMLDFKDRQISELSGGQQQRAFIARALVQKADIYLMDEPFQGVDSTTEKSIVDILKKLKSEGKTLIVVHHDLQTVPTYFETVTFINKSVIASGKIKEVFTQENIDMAYKK